jgi:Sulfotransferase family
MRPAQSTGIAPPADEVRSDTSSVLFILCPPRSYSSVICAMLGQHPACYAFPELALFVADTVQGLFDFHREHCGGMWTAAYCSPGLIRALAQLHDGAQTEQTIDGAIDWLRDRRHWICQRVLDHLLSQIQPAMGIDKSPLTSIFPEFLARARAWYPHARFVHLTRHPVSSLRSLVRHFRARLLRVQPDVDARGVAEFFASMWCRGHSSIIDLSRELPPGQYMRVHAENVLLNPGRELTRVVRWLGLRSDRCVVDSMMHPERSPYAHFGPGIARGANDPKFLESPRLRRIVPPFAPEFGPDCHLAVDRQAEMYELALQLGYPVPERVGAAAA